jgi:uncharacterized protein YecE (DUF72 family)
MNANLSTNMYIGTSGWNYKNWKNDFYNGVKQKEWLEHYSNIFKAVEVNATFYRLLKHDTLQSWYNRTPQEFAFAVKGSRYLTHIKRLKEPLEGIQKQKENLAPLSHKLKVVLWQLPGSLQNDLQKLENFAKALSSWTEVRHAIEFRHPSWFDNQTASLLSSFNMSCCISDAGDWPLWDIVTTDLVYIRLHGSPSTYISDYSQEELQSWAAILLEWIKKEHEIHIYFDNTDQGQAPKNAQQLQKMLHSEPSPFP